MGLVCEHHFDSGTLQSAILSSLSKIKLCFKSLVSLKYYQT